MIRSVSCRVGSPLFMHKEICDYQIRAVGDEIKEAVVPHHRRYSKSDLPCRWLLAAGWLGVGGLSR